MKETTPTVLIFENKPCREHCISRIINVAEQELRFVPKFTMS